MGIINWIRKQATALTLAMSNVEKNAFSQNGEQLGQNVALERKHSQGTLADDLLRGELTQEVKDLRWRTYKVIQASEKVNVKLTPVLKMDEEGHLEIETDEDGNIIYTNITVSLRNLTEPIMKVKVDTFDQYPVEMVVNNAVITAGAFEDGQDVSTFNSYFANNINERPVKVMRDFMPKFEIENYTNKMVVRNISETEKLLEFYVSIYSNEHNMSTKLFNNELKKVIASGPDKINSLEIKEVGFISHNTLGVHDFHAFAYKITSFDKIVEFDGNYVIKFKAKVIINGENMLNKFMEEKLENKYQNVEAKKVTI